MSSTQSFSSEFPPNFQTEVAPNRRRRLALYCGVPLLVLAAGAAAYWNALGAKAASHGHGEDGKEALGQAAAKRGAHAGAAAQPTGAAPPAAAPSASGLCCRPCAPGETPSTGSAALERTAGGAKDARQGTGNAAEKQRRETTEDGSGPSAGAALGSGRKTDPEDLVRQAGKLVRQGKREEAEQLYRLALSLDSRTHAAAAGIAQLRLRQGNARNAWHWAERALRISPNMASYHVLQGDAFQQMGNAAAAMGSWRRALQIDPENRRAQSRLTGGDPE